MTTITAGFGSMGLGVPKAAHTTMQLVPNERADPRPGTCASKTHRVSQKNLRKKNKTTIGESK